MASYRYVARDRDGNVTSGVLSARNDTEVRSILRGRDLYLTSCNLAEGGQTKTGQTSFFTKKVKLNDLVVASRQLATMVRAGLSITEALGALADQTENPTLVETIRQVRLDVLTGLTLADAFRKHPKVFSEIFVSLVEVGEAGGTLDQTLEIAAQQYNDEAELREQVKAAMTYPIIVIVATILVIAVMLLFVVPVFDGVYSRFGKELPAITQSLITISRAAKTIWWVALLIIVGGVYLFRRYYASNDGRHRIDALKLRLPLVGKLLRKISIARFTQTFAAVTRGGVPMIKALTTSAGTTGNIILKDAVMVVCNRVSEGAPLSTPLADSGEFPPMVTRMIAAGESTGNLDEMLEEITRFYQRDIEYSVHRLTRMLEPIMTVFVGGVVLFVLLALYMPVFTLPNVIKR